MTFQKRKSSLRNKQMDDVKRMRFVLLIQVCLFVLIVFSSAQQQVKWNKCAPISQPESILDKIFRKKNTEIAECTTFKVPLHWNTPNTTSSNTLQFFVKRFLSQRPSSVKGMLWLLEGGPGLDGTRFEYIADAIREELDDRYDIYIPDHRGTGRSSPLICSGTRSLYSKDQSEVDQCFNDLVKQYSRDGLSGFGTTEAAHDIAYAINMIRKKTDKVVVYGVSYGTYLLNRLLTIYPTLVDIAVADSVLIAGPNLIRKDSVIESVGRSFMDTCQRDSFCSRKMNGAVHSVFTRVFERQNSKSPCVGGKLAGNQLPAVLSRFLIHRDLRKFIFPIIYRLNRCNSGDRKWLENVSYTLSHRNSLKVPNQLTQIASGSTYHNYNLNHMMLLISGELSDLSQPEDTDGTLFFNPDIGSVIETVARTLNISFADPFRGKYATKYSNPLLILQGTLDANTPDFWASEWKNRFVRRYQHIVLFPHAVHGVLTRTPMKSAPDRHCALYTMAQFVKNSTLVPDTTCIKDYVDYKLDFNNLSLSYLVEATYSKDLWEAGPVFTYNQIWRRKISISVAVVSLVSIIIIAGILFAIAVFCGSCTSRSSKMKITTSLKQSIYEQLLLEGTFPESEE
jgi:pimeloyl-ACP methyl ester carboxylesterase